MELVKLCADSLDIKAIWIPFVHPIILCQNYGVYWGETRILTVLPDSVFANGLIAKACGVSLDYIHY